MKTSVLSDSVSGLAADARKMPGVSVVIATRDRPEDLVRCLASVLTQDYAGELEVIVVDQSTDDDARRRIEALDSSVVRYVHEDTPGKARALNRALALARGDLLLLTDDDCCPGNGWLATMASRFLADEGLSVVFGPVVSAPHDRARYYVPVFEPRRPRRLHGISGRFAGLGLGASMAVRRTAVEAIGGWDEHIGPGSEFRSGDDNDIAYRCLVAGGAVLIEMSSQVVHFGMRPYAAGGVQRLHRNNYYGLGATLMKQVRCGDPVALCRLLGTMAGELASLPLNVVRHRRLTGAGRVVALLKGARSAATHAIDRGTRRFEDG